MRPLLAAHIRPSALSLPSLAKWWDARFVDGSSNALDRSGNSKLGTNASVSIQTNVDRGRPVFRFNGTTSKLTFSSITTGTSFSAFARLKNTTNVTARSMMCWTGGGTNRQLLGGDASNHMGCYDGTNNPVSGVVDNYSAFVTIGVVCTSGTPIFYLDGASVGTGGSTLSSYAINEFGRVLTVFSTMDLTACLLATAAFNANQIALATHILTNQ
jgi:hypothetical protein